MDAIVSCSSSTSIHTPFPPVSDDLWNKLDDGIIEYILAHMFYIDIFRCQLVSTKWNSIIHSPCFQKTSDKLAQHQPWFFLVSAFGAVSVVYDTEVKTWRQVHFPTVVNPDGEILVPLASSGGLLCVITKESRDLIVCNPFNGSKRLIPKKAKINENMESIILHASGASYKLFVVFRKKSQHFVRVYSSEENTWRKIALREQDQKQEQEHIPMEDQEFQYLVKKIVVNWDISMACHRVSGVSTIDRFGKILLYYMKQDVGLYCCDVEEGRVYIYGYSRPSEEVGYHLVECRGRILVLFHVQRSIDGDILLQLLEFEADAKVWKEVATVPQHISQKYTRPLFKVQCGGAGDCVMVCIVYHEGSDVLLYNILDDSWQMLPPYINYQTGYQQELDASFANILDDSWQGLPLYINYKTRYQQELDASFAILPDVQAKF